jgi:hypothetical protein
MTSPANDALAPLRQLGTVEQLRDRAGAPQPLRVNSHIHLPPNFSAFETVADAVDRAAAEGINVLGVSNYYDFTVYGEFARLARDKGIFPLFGLEIICKHDDLAAQGVRINDPGNPGKMYLCGKGITRFGDEMTDTARRILNTIRDNDAARMREMTDKLSQLLAGAEVDAQLGDDDVIDMVVARHGAARETVTLQERHVAQGCQRALAQAVPADHRSAALERLFGQPATSDVDDPVAVQGEIRSRLMKAGKPAFVGETFISFHQARTLILELGGIPCYPTLADGVEPFCEYETPVEQLIENIQSAGIHAAELVPTRNRPEVLAEYVTTMRAAGLVVTAGTEHNTLDLGPIEPLCKGGQPIPAEALEIFQEGARVVAAHQLLTLGGRPGLVDAAGKPNDAYASADERIAALARLGSAVIDAYREGT